MPQIAEVTSEDGWVGQVSKIAEEAEVAGLEGGLLLIEEQPREEADRQKKPGRQAIHRVPSGDGPPPGATQWMCG